MDTYGRAMMSEKRSEQDAHRAPSPGTSTTEDAKLEKAVEDTFPASDPPSETQPGSGITEPEVIDKSKIKRG
jgi:hypothetical protein